MNRKTITIIFWIAAFYEGLLGIAFLFASSKVFQYFDVTPPNHVGYVQFPAAVLIIFGLMFLAIARDPVGKKDLIPYGALLKLSYCGVVLVHWLSTDLPSMWKPFFYFDLVFLVLFVLAWRSLSTSSENSTSQTG